MQREGGEWELAATDFVRSYVIFISAKEIGQKKSAELRSSRAASRRVGQSPNDRWANVPIAKPPPTPLPPAYTLLADRTQRSLLLLLRLHSAISF